MWFKGVAASVCNILKILYWIRDGGLNFRHAQQHFDQLVGGQDMVKQYSNFLFSMT